MNEPLGTSEIKIDVVTGEPFTAEEIPRKEYPGDEIGQERSRLEKAVSQRNDLIADLQGTGGTMVREVVKLFVKRLETLSQGDAECMAYMKMLGAAQHTINVGERTITKMAEDLLKYAAPEGDTGKNK